MQTQIIFAQFKQDYLAPRYDEGPNQDHADDDILDIIRFNDLPHDTTILNYLREYKQLKGTKEGCGEGDCGACTVIVLSLQDNQLCWQAVNSCILLVGQLHGKILITIEDLSKLVRLEDLSLHPIQSAMVKHHGSQCGFCTPGIVMSLAAYYHEYGHATRDGFDEQLSGNLCRCTGYNPILKAAKDAFENAPNKRLAPRLQNALMQCLSNLHQGDDDLFIDQTPRNVDPANIHLANAPQTNALEEDMHCIKDSKRFFAGPCTLSSLLELYQYHPDSVLLSGGTDIGLWITKQLRDLPKIIWIGRIQELSTIEDKGDYVDFGAAVTYANAQRILDTIHPSLGILVKRIGGAQIRSYGTIGGNIANGSPIADMSPALIALGCTIRLTSNASTRDLDLEDFFIEYAKQDINIGEIVERVFIDKLISKDQHFRVWKLSKRRDQDIATLTGAFKLKLDKNYIMQARVAFGGMAATPKRALACERALIGIDITKPKNWQASMIALENDFTPIDDMRSNKEYRTHASQNLLHKCLMEISANA